MFPQDLNKFKSDHIVYYLSKEFGNTYLLDFCHLTVYFHSFIYKLKSIKNSTI